MEPEDRVHVRRDWRPPRMMILVVAILIVAGGAALFFASKGQAAESQPIDFPHVLMVQSGITCQYCHTGTIRSPAAGMPSVEKCMGCHKVINPTAPEVVKLAGFWDRQQTIPWVKNYRTPRFVYFSHEVHVTAGQLPCDSCHGDVGHMREAKPVYRINMGFCLNCHEKQPDSPKLKDCFVCHQ